MEMWNLKNGNQDGDKLEGWGEEQQDSPRPWIMFTKPCTDSHHSPAFSNFYETHWQKYIPLCLSIKLQQTYLCFDCLMNATGRSGSKSSSLAHNCYSYKLMHNFSRWLSQEFGCPNPAQVILKEDQGCNARHLRNEDVSELKQSVQSLFCLLLHINYALFPFRSFCLFSA